MGSGEPLPLRRTGGVAAWADRRCKGQLMPLNRVPVIPRSGPCPPPAYHLPCGGSAFILSQFTPGSQPPAPLPGKPCRTPRLPSPPLSSQSSGGPTSSLSSLRLSACEASLSLDGGGLAWVSYLLVLSVFSPVLHTQGTDNGQ